MGRGETVVELTQQDSGGRRTARIGEELSVVLAENPTTGYRWHSEIDETRLEPTEDRYEGPAEPRGAAGVHRVTFKVIRAGPARLRLVKRRAWEDVAVEEFHIDLDVEED